MTLRNNFLELNNNQITTIQEGTFQDIPALNTLSLDNNPLDCLDCEMYNFKLFLLNNTHLSDASATCNGTSTRVLDYNVTECAEGTTAFKTEESTTVLSTIDSTTVTSMTEDTPLTSAKEDTPVTSTKEDTPVTSMNEDTPLTSENEGTTVASTNDGPSLASTGESTTGTLATLYIVGTVGALVAIMILVGAVLGTCVIYNRMKMKKKSRIEPSDRS
ncbi:uncharacterized protein LOC134709880 [Mytilus trossulus]|uniref:uncharacterized protein LOC134709880 n=1 Tax=Mytilus trossulus TaxID=6551 RepID=UPI0030042CE8